MRGYRKGTIKGVNRIRNEMDRRRYLDEKFVKENPAAAEEMRGKEAQYATVTNCPEWDQTQFACKATFYKHVHETHVGCEHFLHATRDVLKEHIEAKKATENSQ